MVGITLAPLILATLARPIVMAIRADDFHILVMSRFVSKMMVVFVSDAVGLPDVPAVHTGKRVRSWQQAGFDEVVHAPPRLFYIAVPRRYE